MSPKHAQCMSYKQHITKNPPLSTHARKHPPSHRKENLAAVNGASKTGNTKQLIFYIKTTLTDAKLRVSDAFGSIA